MFYNESPFASKSSPIVAPIVVSGTPTESEYVAMMRKILMVIG